MSKFQVGDRVYCEDAHVDGVHLKDRYGTVCHIYFGAVPEIGVRWDEALHGGHECSGFCEQGYGYYVYESNLQFVEDPCSEEEANIDLGELL